VVGAAAGLAVALALAVHQAETRIVGGEPCRVVVWAHEVELLGVDEPVREASLPAACVIYGVFLGFVGGIVGIHVAAGAHTGLIFLGAWALGSVILTIQQQTSNSSQPGAQNSLEVVVTFVAFLGAGFAAAISLRLQNKRLIGASDIEFDQDG
jgi:hypothetical protein